MNLERSIISFLCSLVPLPSRVKNGADVGPSLLVASAFTLPAPGSHWNLVASPATASTLARCVLNSSRAAAYAYGEIGNGNTNERTTMIDLDNFLKPCDRFYESGRLGTCEKETKGMLKGMKRPHLMPLHDVSTRQVSVGDCRCWGCNTIRIPRSAPTSRSRGQSCCRK